MENIGAKALIVDLGVAIEVWRHGRRWRVKPSEFRPGEWLALFKDAKQPMVGWGDTIFAAIDHAWGRRLGATAKEAEVAERLGADGGGA